MSLNNKKFSGYYTCGFVNDGIFEKHISFHSQDEYFLYHEIFNCNFELICRYYNELKESEIYMPEIIELLVKGEEIILKQEYIKGEKLIDWIKNNPISECWKKHINYFDILLSYQFSSYQTNNRLKIDFNLNNFIIKDGRLYLVDIIPAIYINEDSIKKWEGSSENIRKLLSLYCNIDCQIAAIIGYWIFDCFDKLNKILEPDRRNIIKRVLKKFINHANLYLKRYTLYNSLDKKSIYSNSHNFYYKKLFLIFQYLDNKIEFKELMNYKKTPI